jgi:hypothetical protein
MPVPSRLLLLAAAALLPFRTPAAAQDTEFTPAEIKAARQDPDFFKIDPKSISIIWLGPTVTPKDIAPPPQVPGEEPGVDLDSIINIAAKIWAIIEKNKPVVNINTTYATAVPEGIKNWGQLSGWKPPQGTIYAFVAKNKYGARMVDVKYQVLRTYGGSYKGKGQYLTAVTIEPLLVEVGWGYKFDLNAEVPDSSIINVGTSEDPLAGMLAILKWRIQTVVQDTSGRSVYYVQGNGLFKEMGGPFDRGLTEKAGRKLATVPLSVKFD